MRFEQADGGNLPNVPSQVPYIIIQEVQGGRNNRERSSGFRAARIAGRIGVAAAVAIGWSWAFATTRDACEHADWCTSSVAFVRGQASGIDNPLLQGISDFNSNIWHPKEQGK